MQGRKILRATHISASHLSALIWQADPTRWRFVLVLMLYGSGEVCTAWRRSPGGDREWTPRNHVAIAPENSNFQRTLFQRTLLRTSM